MEDKLTVQLNLNLSTSYSFYFFQVFRKWKNRLISWSFSPRNLISERSLLGKRRLAFVPKTATSSRSWPVTSSAPVTYLSAAVSFYFQCCQSSSCISEGERPASARFSWLWRVKINEIYTKSHTCSAHFPSVSPDQLHDIDTFFLKHSWNQVISPISSMPINWMPQRLESLESCNGCLHIF